jgi:hypothetical protein
MNLRRSLSELQWLELYRLTFGLDPLDFVSEVDLSSYQNLFCIANGLSINYFWVLPTLSIQSKGSDSLQSAGSSPGFSVSWSSASTILTLMAWRSNILQKSFVRDCSSLLKNDLRFTCRWQSLQLAVACCAFCALFMCYQKCLNFAVLKVLPSGCGGCCQPFVAEAASFVGIHQTH